MATLLTITALLENSETGQEEVVNVILDTGSNITLLSERIAEKLKLSGKEINLDLSGVGDKRTLCKSKVVNVKVTSMNHTFCMELEKVQVVRSITKDYCAYDWTEYLKRFGLSGYPPTGSGQIDLLVGLDFPSLLIHRDYKEAKGKPVAIKTHLGWSCSGPISDLSTVQALHTRYRERLGLDIENSEDESEESESGESCGEENLISGVRGLCLLNQTEPENSSELKRVLELLECQWKHDNFPEKGNTVEENYAIKILNDSYRVIDGHVYVSQLWKDGQPSGFVNNYPYALNRLKSVVKGLNEIEFMCINKIFNSYLDMNICEDVTAEVLDVFAETAIYWAHFAVKQPKSETTPVRPVLDGAARCLGGKSINDHCFMQGPNMMCVLTQVLLRFRQYDVAFTGDVSKMFLKIRTPPEMRKFSRILWVDANDRKKIRILQFKGHIFGNNGSPTCSMYATQRNATDHKGKFPRAAESVLESTIVDDTLDSVPTSEEAVEIINNLVEMHKAIGLEMAKFGSNRIEVSNQLPSSARLSETMVSFVEYGSPETEYAVGTVPKAPMMRMLGQYWDMSKDWFSYLSYTPDENLVWTKTRCLSQAHKILTSLSRRVSFVLTHTDL
jgi:hypothetical protein